jgi:hypothetical protein
LEKRRCGHVINPSEQAADAAPHPAAGSIRVRAGVARKNPAAGFMMGQAAACIRDPVAGFQTGVEAGLAGNPEAVSILGKAAVSIPG